MKNVLIPPVFIMISLILIISFRYIIPEYNLLPFPYNYGGFLLVFLGMGIMGTTFKLFRKHKTTLMIKESSAMIKEGIFSKTRNPMYIGMFLFLIGTAICTKNLFSLIIPFAFILVIRFYSIPREEKMLEEVFGEEYREYKKKVRRLL